MTSPEARSLADRWAAFEQLPTLRDHWWWRPGWSTGRRFYAWHLTFDGATALHELATKLQAAIIVPVVDPLPLDGLHLTMQAVGFHPRSNRDRYRDDRGGRPLSLRDARNLHPRPLRFRRGRHRPWQPVIQPRRTLRAANADVWGPRPRPRTRLPPPTSPWPTANTDASPADLVTCLAPLRDEPPATVPISTAKLIELNRDDKVYRWDVAASVELGS